MNEKVINEVDDNPQIINNVPKTDLDTKSVAIISSILTMIVGVGIVFYVNKKKNI